jgi:asparagine synthase (glutamine-hydrolysing)
VSGMVGMWNIDGSPIIRQTLESMVEVLSHRGPDDSGIWVDGFVGLGHRMLWTTPESLYEKLPLVSSNGDLIITADARIDNRDELLSALDMDDRTCPDSQLILEVYRKWDEDCPKQLLGDFSFAIWDRRRRRLFCARDHFGVRPFYYHHNPGRLFIFGSEIKALLRSELVSRQHNERRIGQFLADNAWFEETIETFYSQIVRLPAAHVLIIDHRSALLRKYWELDPYAELHFSSDDEYAEAFRAVFTEAVRWRLRSAYPVGAELSGGLDSSSVVGAARQILARGTKSLLHTITVTYDAVPSCDERFYSEAISQQNGIVAHRVSGDDLNPFSDIERMLWHQDEPVLAPYLCLDREAIYPCARQQGIRVLMDGCDGDNIVGWGLYWPAELVRSGHFAKAARELYMFSRRSGRSLRRVIRECMVEPLAPKYLLRQLALRYQQISVLDTGFARRVGLGDKRAENAPAACGRFALSRFDHWENLSPGQQQNPLETYNKAVAPFGIELRSPFFDRRLVELCLAFPGDQKLRDGWSKFVLRNAVRGIVPERIRLRDWKTTVTPNYDRILVRFGSSILDQSILRPSGRLAGIVDIDQLHKIYANFVSGHDRSGRYTIWAAAILDIWLQNNS